MCWHKKICELHEGVSLEIGTVVQILVVKISDKMITFVTKTAEKRRVTPHKNVRTKE